MDIARILDLHTKENSQKSSICEDSNSEHPAKRSKRVLGRQRQDIKKKAIGMFYDGKTKAEVSRLLSIPDSTLRGWIKALPFTPKKSASPISDTSDSITTISTNSDDNSNITDDIPSTNVTSSSALHLSRKRKRDFSDIEQGIKFGNEDSVNNEYRENFDRFQKAFPVSTVANPLLFNDSMKNYLLSGNLQNPPTVSYNSVLKHKIDYGYTTTTMLQPFAPHLNHFNNEALLSSPLSLLLQNNKVAKEQIEFEKENSDPQIPIDNHNLFEKNQNPIQQYHISGINHFEKTKVKTELENGLLPQLTDKIIKNLKDKRSTQGNSKIDNIIITLNAKSNSKHKNKASEPNLKNTDEMQLQTKPINEEIPSFDEAIEHAKRFQTWMENCSNPVVTVFKIKDFRKFINAIIAAKNKNI